MCFKYAPVRGSTQLTCQQTSTHLITSIKIVIVLNLRKMLISLANSFFTNMTIAYSKMSNISSGLNWLIEMQFIYIPDRKIGMPVCFNQK